MTAHLPPDDRRDDVRAEEATRTASLPALERGHDGQATGASTLTGTSRP